MRKVSRITVSLPSDILRVSDQERRRTGESRSELVRRAIKELIRERLERDAVDRYVAGYLAQPETADEQAWIDRSGRDLLERS